MELQKYRSFSDCDFNTLEIIALPKKAPLWIIEANLDKVILNLERQIAFGLQ